MSIEVVTNNPCQLAADIYGIGFLTADTIARNLGVFPASPFRYRAGITHVLGEAAENGHCFLPLRSASNAATQIFKSIQNLSILLPLGQTNSSSQDIVFRC